MNKTGTTGAKKAALIVLLLVGAANLAYGGWLFFTEGRVELPLFIAGVVTGGLAVVLGATGTPPERR
jgi:Cu2+-containing amine oxidase